MISEVGYLHEHPDIEQLMKRKGIPAINEDELLQIMDLALTIVTKKISNLILLPVEKLEPKQHLDEFGLDSMLTAEFRTFIFKALEVDIPFIMLLAKNTSANDLMQLIADGLGEKVSNDV